MNPIGYDYVASPSEFARSKYFYALIGGTIEPNGRFFFERSYYPAYEILVILSGKGWYRHGNQWIAVGSGDCLLYDMRYPHAYKADPDHPFQGKWLVFDGHLLDKLWNDYFVSPYAILHPESTGPLMDALDRIVRAAMEQSNPNDSEMQISALIYQLLIQCVNQEHKEKRAVILAKPDSMIASQKYMDEHYLTISDMPEVARHANLSYYHFNRQFRRCFGCTPNEYILIKKVSHAKRLLLLTNLTMMEIAEQSGFHNYNSFLYTFRRIEKCSPTHYRINWKLY